MEQLRQFLEKRPAIRLHYESEGSFHDYSRHVQARMPLHQSPRLARIISEQARRLLGAGVHPLLLQNQLARYPLISTADHAGLLNYSILYNANLMLSGLLGIQALPYQVVLASSRVPLNNASHPRGFLFQTVKYNFFPVRQMRSPLCLLEGGLEHAAGASLADLLGSKAMENLPPAQRAFLEHLFYQALDLPDICRQFTRFDEQIPLLNQRLWEFYFRADVRVSRPSLIYMATENILDQLLREDLPDPASVLHPVLFDPAVRNIYLKEFDGMTGCWGQDYGTHFFWGASPKRTLHGMRVNAAGTMLEPVAGADGQAFPLEPQAILEALAAKLLVPSLFVEMFLLAFVEGYTLLGGFNQVNYLAWMRVAHEKAMLIRGDWPKAARFARVPNDGLICGLTPFAWDSGLDLIWDHNSRNGRFNGNLDNGLGTEDLERMLRTSMRSLIESSVQRMLELVE